MCAQIRVSMSLPSVEALNLKDCKNNYCGKGHLTWSKMNRRGTLCLLEQNEQT